MQNAAMWTMVPNVKYRGQTEIQECVSEFEHLRMKLQVRDENVMNHNLDMA